MEEGENRVMRRLGTRVRLIRYSLRTNGLGNTVKNVFSTVADFVYDLINGTDTRAWVALDDMMLEAGQKVGANMYAPTHAFPLRRLFRDINFPPGLVLLDLGCGKGRGQLIASEFGFREARGVEFSPVLCDIARRNCELYSIRRKTKTAFSVINADARDYAFRDDEDVVYLCDPFNGQIMMRVLELIADSLSRRDRTLWIVYKGPTERAVIERSGLFAVEMEKLLCGQRYVVYAHRCEQGRALG